MILPDEVRRDPLSYAELERAHDGPIPPQYLRPPALTRAELVCDQAKTTACRRKLALAALAERRRIWNARLPYPGIFDYADRCARLETRLWAEARATLAQYRDELAEQ